MYGFLWDKSPIGLLSGASRAKCACSVGHSGSSSGFSGARLSYAQATLTSSSPARSDFMLRRGVPVFYGG